ncbi:MAG: hypothetical protein ACRDTJ_29870, partial [Pseudonocardiaceae bacterium]
VLNPVGGVIASRMRPRPGVVIGLLGYAGLLTCAAAAMWFGSAAVFVTASLLGGVLQGVAATCAMRILLPRTQVSDRADVLAAIYFVSYGSVAVAGIGAAFLAPRLPLESVAVIYAAIGVTAAIGGSLLPPRTTANTREGQT